MFQWLKASGAKKVMDFGCGYSPFPQYLCDNGFEVWGVDDNSWKTMDRINKNGSVHYHIGNILDLDERFDVIFSCSVIEHIAPEERMPIFHKMRELSGKMCHIIDYYWPDKRSRHSPNVDFKGVCDELSFSYDPVFCPGAAEFSFNRLRHEANDPHIDFIYPLHRKQESRIMIGDDV